MTIIINGLREAHPDFSELLDYSGMMFNPYWCELGDQKIAEERQHYATEDEFNRNTLIFCYQSIALSWAGMHRPYLAELLIKTANKSNATVIDYGAGSGQDGLTLHTAGLNVVFADIYSRSMMFLEWRLRRRNLNLPIFNLDSKIDVLPRRDYAICFDVLEHLERPQQESLLNTLASIAGCCFVNLIRGNGSDITGVHHDVDAEQLTKYAVDKWPATYYKDFYYNANTDTFNQRLLVFGDECQQ